MLSFHLFIGKQFHLMQHVPREEMQRDEGRSWLKFDSR